MEPYTLADLENIGRLAIAVHVADKAMDRFWDEVDDNSDDYDTVEEERLFTAWEDAKEALSVAIDKVVVLN